MKNAIQILYINYFAENNESENWNAKVRYTKNGKRYLAIVYLDYANREVYFPKYPKDSKVLKGLDYAIKIEEKFI
jgi:hypothetical protein